MALYDRYELLELFDNERIVEEALGNVEYTLRTADGHTLCLFIAPIEHFITLTLEYKQQPVPLFDIGFHNIVKIICNNQKTGVILLSFYKKDSENPAFSLMVKPYISFNGSFR